MTQNVTVYNPFRSYFQQYTINRTESYEQDTQSRSRLKMMLLRNTEKKGASDRQMINLNI
jgi:hypothetical protein